MPGVGELLVLAVVVLVAGGGGTALVAQLRDRLTDQTRQRVAFAIKARLPVFLHPYADDLLAVVVPPEPVADEPSGPPTSP